MSGSKIGGAKARDRNLSNNPNFYADIGRIGGRNSSNGGFAHDSRTFWQKLLRKPKASVLAGRKGGAISRRNKVAE